MAKDPTNNPTVNEIDQTLLCVRVPATSLRKEPVEPGQGDPGSLQESQLLANELFLSTGEEQDWCYGEAIEQFYHTDKGWGGYPGWVRKRELIKAEMTQPRNAVVISQEADVFADPICSGQSLTVLPVGSRVRFDLDARPGFSRVLLHSGQAGWMRKDALRVFDDSATDLLSDAKIREVISNAFLFLGVPYLWGGMNASRHTPSGATWGVDCSALVCLSYRLSGVDIPRNACDQQIFARPIEGDDVRAGDLVFIAQEGSPRVIRHVMICTGAESIIEASQTGRTVAETTFAEKFGLSYDELKEAGFETEGRKIYLGRISKGFKGAESHRPLAR
jgi:hypothetical protein